MPSTFLGINIGASGLAAAQIGQDVTGNNISNANTPGYSVESANFQANPSLSPPDSVSGSLPNGQIGTGVSVVAISRSHDVYLDNQVRAANASVGSASAQSGSLQQIEQAYNEPSSSGLNAALTQFYQGFNSVVSDPSNLGARSTAIQNGVTVANALQSVSSQLTGIGTQLAAQSANDLQTINTDAAQIASLNKVIRASNTAGQQPNTLLDQRDQLLDKISSLANISTQFNADGTVNVALGTTDLVVGMDVNTVTLAGLQSRGDLQSGELAGVVASQAQVQSNQASLNNLAAAVASQVNTVQSTGAGLDGSTGLNFFSVTAGSEASSIAVNPALVADPSKLAAAAVPSGGGVPPPGDGANASALATLQNQAVAGGPLAGVTTLGFYQQTVTEAGSLAASAKTAVAAAQTSQSQLSTQRTSETGVSTDQEMINMLQYQRAYQASARVIQTMDSMLNTLITGLFP